VRYSAHSVRLGKTGSVYTDVTVPDFDKAKLSLSGVVVSGDAEPVAAPKDAFASIIPVVPTTQREFGRGDRVKAFVRIYQGGRQAPGGVEVAAHLVDATGLDVSSATSAVAAEAFAKTRGADYSYDLRLASLAPGAYLLTIEARLGSVTSRRDVRFLVR
jgi:hypothetical protein